MCRQLFILMMAMGCFIFASAHAQDDSQPKYGNFFQGFEVQVGAEIPMDVGLRVRTLLPNDFYVVTGIGYTPPFMGDAIGSFSNALGMEGSSSSRVMAQAMDNAFYLDVRLGYKFRTSSNYFEGFFIDVGYSLLVGGGGNPSNNDVIGTTGNIYPNLTQYTGVNVKSTLHDVTLHAGYTANVLGNFIFTGELGLVKPVASVNSVTSGNLDAYTLSQVQNDLNNSLSTDYQRYLFIPTVSIWLSYLF